LFYWSALERQVRIDGTVERVSEAESDAYFSSRPRGHQVSAWASPQSSPVSGREELERLRAEAEARFADAAHIPRPPFWGGYRLRPEAVEFWQGRADRLHDRIEYRLENGVWRMLRLAP
jgi:pyridoxamine 5'-phosphate oxidase